MATNLAVLAVLNARARWIGDALMRELKTRGRYEGIGLMEPATPLKACLSGGGYVMHWYWMLGRRIAYSSVMVSEVMAATSTPGDWLWGMMRQALEGLILHVEGQLTPSTIENGGTMGPERDANAGFYRPAREVLRTIRAVDKDKRTITFDEASATKVDIKASATAAHNTPRGEDGEVICQQCHSKLNRADRNCWRCGSTKLEQVTPFIAQPDDEITVDCTTLVESMTKKPGVQTEVLTQPWGGIKGRP